MEKNIRFTLAAILLFSLFIIENIYAGINNYGMECRFRGICMLLNYFLKNRYLSLVMIV